MQTGLLRFALIELTDQAHQRLEEIDQKINVELSCTDGPVHDAYARATQQVQRLAGLFAVGESIAAGNVPSPSPLGRRSSTGRRRWC